MEDSAERTAIPSGLNHSIQQSLRNLSIISRGISHAQINRRVRKCQWMVFDYINLFEHHPLLLLPAAAVSFESERIAELVWRTLLSVVRRVRVRYPTKYLLLATTRSGGVMFVKKSKSQTMKSLMRYAGFIQTRDFSNLGSRSLITRGCVWMYSPVFMSTSRCVGRVQNLWSNTLIGLRLCNKGVMEQRRKQLFRN